MIRVGQLLLFAAAAFAQTSAPAPHYWVMEGANYNGHAMPFTSVGVSLVGGTYGVFSLETPIHAPATVQMEICQHLTQRGRLGLWGMAGVGMQNSSVSTAPGAVTFGAFASFRLTTSGLFMTAGVRAINPVSSSSTNNNHLSVDKLFGMGWYF
jgi:hypothetical protein